VAAACALVLAGVASADALVSQAPGTATPRATCSLAQKANRTQALTAFKRSMATKRKRFFRAHKNRKARARFVRAQQQTLARLTSAARCGVTQPQPTSTGAPTTTQPGQTSASTTRPGTTTSTTRSTTSTTTHSTSTTTTPTSSPGPATATVVKKGFREVSYPGLIEADYGVVLANTSSDHDAKSVQVTVSALDGGGATLSSDTTTLFAIPAGTTYAFGGEIIRPTGAGVPTVTIAVSVTIGQSVAKVAAPPPIANVRVEPGAPGGVDVVGEVANPGGAPLSTLARVTAVLFDGAGNAIGGNTSFLQADVPHGARIGFTVHIAAVAPGSVASAQVSIEPRYNSVLPTGPAVAVQKMGFSEAPIGSTREADYGVVLRNTSATLDGVDVEIIVDAVDANHVVVGTDGRLVLAIPAGATYYFGGSIVHSAARSATSLEVYMLTAVGAPAALPLPGSANVHMVSAGAGSQIAGELVNTAAHPLSSLARITGVVFDGAGNVIGGGAAYQPSTVAPGAHAAFTLPAKTVPFGAAASAQVSAEPEYN